MEVHKGLLQRVELRRLPRRLQLVLQCLQLYHRVLLLVYEEAVEALKVLRGEGEGGLSGLMPLLALKFVWVRASQLRPELTPATSKSMMSGLMPGR